MATPVVEHVVFIEAEGAPALSPFGGSSWFPAPKLGSDCVCCGSKKAGLHRYDPSGDQQAAGRVEIPLCDDCDGHVAKSHAVEQLLIIPLGLGPLLVLIAPFAGAWEPAAAGALIVGAAIAIFVLRRWRLRSAARSGHHRLFEITVAGGHCAVRTTSAALAKDLLARHGTAARLVKPSGSPAPAVSR